MRRLEEIRKGVARCAQCPLVDTRRQTVPGEGPQTAKIVLVGEAPGYYEDKRGRPFIGQAGNLLDELFAEIGLNRAEVFLTNVLKCRPSQNRDPKISELEACRGWLDAQLAALTHKQVIVAMGRFASLYLCPTEKPAHIRGTARRVEGLTHLFLFHPAAALHNPRMRPELSRGFELLRTLIA